MLFCLRLCYNCLMQATLDTFPKNISRHALARLGDDLARREAILKSIIHRFETQYNVTLEAFEARLAQGKGREHPDWEDSIEWRNALDELKQTDLMKRVLEWLLHSKAR